MIDNWSRQRHEPAFYGLVSEKRGTFQLKANTKHEIHVVFCNVRGPAGDEEVSVLNAYIHFFLRIFIFLADRSKNVFSTTGVLRLGGAEIQDSDGSDKLLEQAVDLAKDADAVIAVVGLNEEWETEGIDRTTLALPGRTDELISRVAAVNSKTVVVTHAVCWLSLSIKKSIIF